MNYSSDWIRDLENLGVDFNKPILDDFRINRLTTQYYWRTMDDDSGTLTVHETSNVIGVRPSRKEPFDFFEVTTEQITLILLTWEMNRLPHS